MNLPSIYSGDQPYIFVSFSHRDSARVYPIIERLQERGYRVWYDAGIEPGTEWDENIAARIIQCGYVFAFMSAAYLKSENCRDELNFARDKDKPRLLVFLDELELPDGMAMRLNRLQAVYWNRFTNNREALDKICAAQGLEACRQSGPFVQLSDFAIADVPERAASKAAPVSAAPKTKPTSPVPPTKPTAAPPAAEVPTRSQLTNVQDSGTETAAASDAAPKSKWKAFFLCLFLGVVGAHKFYEGKTGMGLLYLFTFGLCFVGALVDLIVILTKPNPYYVSKKRTTP